METEIQQIGLAAKQQVEAAKSLAELEELRVHYLGKKGILANFYKQLAQAEPAQKSVLGQVLNSFKEGLLQQLDETKHQLEKIELNQKLEKEKLDITLPARGLENGRIHPLTQVISRVEKLLHSLSYEKAIGPEIEDDYHNFTALNFPESHPARAMLDTFFFEDGRLLRTHTSTVQIRALKAAVAALQNQPEQDLSVRLYALGRVYRRDSDQTHTPMFHQLEGLVVNQTASFAELRLVLEQFVNQFFGRQLNFRFRPSYFPFTEPSAEMDMSCVICDAQGCRVCKNTGWLEVLGCGMVHPNVLKNVGIDPDKYRGYAFGIGLDRLTMLYLKINDLRKLFENDLRFLEQF